MPPLRRAVPASVAACLVAFGCGHAPVPTSEPSANDPKPTATSKPSDPPQAEQAPATNRPPNPEGLAFVPMFHHLGDKKNSMYIKPDEFTEELTRMEKLGFRPVTVSEFLAGCPSLALGATPAVMTFDDSNADQLQLLPDGSLDPNCFMGLWQTFAKTHPDFPIKATFFVLPNSFFGRPAEAEAKLKLIKSWGCEIANHTITHPILRKLSDAAVEKEIGDAEAWLQAHGAAPNAPLALPFGVSPRNKAILEGFSYQGHQVKPAAVFLVGAEPAKMPGQPGFNPLRIPRIQAGAGPYTLDEWLTKAEAGKLKLYVAPSSANRASNGAKSSTVTPGRN